MTNYDGLEFKVERRFARNYIYAASYTYSRLWGNYSGLASSDENGRTDLNVSRAFDLPWETYDARGKQELGVLATDRPHTFKAFVLGRTPCFSNTDLLVHHEFHVPRMNERYKVRIEANVSNIFNSGTLTDVDTNYINSSDGNIQFKNIADFFKGFDYKALMAAQKLRVAPLFGLANSFQNARTIRFGFHLFF